MTKVLLCYRIEDKEKAEALEKQAASVRMQHYPILGNSFWRELSAGTLNAERIVILCSAELMNQNWGEIEALFQMKSIDDCAYTFVVYDEEAEETLRWYNRRGNNYNADILQAENASEYFSALHWIRNDNEKSRRFPLYSRVFYSVAFYIVCALAGCAAGFFIFRAATAPLFSKGTITAGCVCGVLCSVLIVWGILTRHFSKRQMKEEREKQRFEMNMQQSLSRPKISVPRAAERTETDAEEHIETVRSAGRAKAADKKEGEEPAFVVSGEYDPLGHLMFNWNEMKGYYEISRKQASRSFTLACFSCIAGFLIIVFAVISPIIPVFAGDKNALVPVIGTIGGAVTELFAGTTLIVYTKSLRQMNLYHEALAKYQSYLSCVNLAGRLSTEKKRDAVYMKIIETELQSAAGAVAEETGGEPEKEEKPEKNEV